MVTGAKIMCRKIDLDLEFQFPSLFALYSAHHEGKTFPGNRIIPSRNGKRVSLSFNTVDARMRLYASGLCMDVYINVNVNS